jgi:hypothetical protein
VWLAVATVATANPTPIPMTTAFFTCQTRSIVVSSPLTLVEVAVSRIRMAEWAVVAAERSRSPTVRTADFRQSVTVDQRTRHPGVDAGIVGSVADSLRRLTTVGSVSKSSSTCFNAASVPSRTASRTASGSASARASMMPSRRSSWSDSCFRWGLPFRVAVMGRLRLGFVGKQVFAQEHPTRDACGVRGWDRHGR